MGDFEAVVELHVAGLVGTFDAAVIEKDSDGKVHVHKTELPTQHGAWTGIGVGAVLGILFPPSIIATTVAGGVIGGVTGHLWKGMSRGDLKDLGETCLLYTSDAADDLLCVDLGGPRIFKKKTYSPAQRSNFNPYRPIST